MFNLAPIIQDELRKKKILEQAGMMGGDNPDNPPTFQPNTAAFDMVNKTLSDLPERNDNPSFWRKLGGDIVGMGAGLDAQAVIGGQPIGAKYDPIKANIAADQFINKDYYNKMNDIGNKVNLMQPLMTAENSQNANKLSLFNSAENRKIQQQNADRLEGQAAETARKNKANEDLQREKLEQQKKVADAKQLLAERGEFRSVTGKDGELILYNTKNPQQIIKTGIMTSTLSDMDKIQLRHDAVMQEIAARGEENRETKKTPSGNSSSSSSGMSPTQKTADIQNKAKQAYETHPEWREYIRINPQINKYEIRPPNNYDKEVLNKLGQFVYGENMIKVKHPDGRIGIIPASSLDAAKAQGYSVVEDKK